MDIVGKCLSFVVTFGLFLAPAPAIPHRAEYQVAQILSIKDGSITKSQFIGDSFGGVHFANSRPYRARAFEITITVGEARYDLIHEVRSQSDDLSMLRPGDRLEVRVQESKGRVFIKRPDGKEWKTRIQSPTIR